MENLILQIQGGTELDAEQCADAVGALLSQDISAGQKKAFLVALRAKGETAGELAGFARALLVHAVDPGFELADVPGPMLDVCGTGGDQRGFFNVSTAVMFVAAAAGACVVKHGNRSITSRTGAADVLEELGVQLELNPERLRECVARHGLAFVFAPAWHPAFKCIAPIRKELAAERIPTIFNLLGPLLNPARPPHQLVGLFHPSLLAKYGEALRILGRRSAWAVHGDGTDELALTGPSDVCELKDGAVTSFTIQPGDFGFAQCASSALLGGERAENARILLAILDGSETGPKLDMVLLNSAAALVVSGISADLQLGLEVARKTIHDGAALRKLNALQAYR